MQPFTKVTAVAAPMDLPNIDTDRWHVDQTTLMLIINGLRRWQVRQ